MHWLGFILLLTWTMDALSAESVTALMARADWSCADPRTIGICRRNTPPYVGVKTRYWQPVLLVETTRQTGASGIVEYQSLTSSQAGAGHVRALMREATGVDQDPRSGCLAQADTTALQMTEAHVFGFPFSDAFSVAVEAPCEGPPDLSGVVSYFSEQDAVEWRLGSQEQKELMTAMTLKSAGVCEKHGMLLPGLCVGTWGALYPRTGYSFHAAEAVASGLAAVRAIDNAALRPFSAHRVVSPLLFWPSIRHDRMQLVSPVVRRCMAIGTDPRFWENGTRSSDGRYVWIYWRKKECCLF